ncbi:MAG: LemA family protein [Nanoarchaeota archaeon]
MSDKLVRQMLGPNPGGTTSSIPSRSPQRGSSNFGGTLLLLGVLVVGLMLLLGSCGERNVQNSLKLDVEEAVGNLNVQLQRRYDLIPNIVASVKGEAALNQYSVEIATARASINQIKVTSDMLSDPQAMAAFDAAQSQLAGTLSRLLVVSEQYPNIVGSEAFHDLRIELEGTENRISVARQRFNEMVKRYNDRVTTMPGNFIADFFGFKKMASFEVDEAAKVTPKVDFSK